MPSNEITQILLGWDRDPQAALDQLTPLVYAELRKIAAAYLRRDRPDQTLQPTALIHEAYIRMVENETPNFKDRCHFFGIAARIMRQILADSARRYYAEKRGSGKKVMLDERMEVSASTAGEFLELNEAIDKLNAWDERKCRVIELRYFGGLSREEIAEALGMSLATVKRDLAMGESFLRRELVAQRDSTV